jgi:hypothetical protein
MKHTLYNNYPDSVISSSKQTHYQTKTRCTYHKLQIGAAAGWSEHQLSQWTHVNAFELKCSAVTVSGVAVDLRVVVPRFALEERNI